MNNLPRVPSIEEFDFKLTESVIASPCGTLNAVHLDQQSLAYTVSITSIVEEMPAFLPETQPVQTIEFQHSKLQQPFKNTNQTDEDSRQNLHHCSTTCQTSLKQKQAYFRQKISRGKALSESQQKGCSKVMSDRVLGLRGKNSIESRCYRPKTQKQGRVVSSKSTKRLRCMTALPYDRISQQETERRSKQMSQIVKSVKKMVVYKRESFLQDKQLEMLSYIMKVKKMTIGNDEQKSRLYLKKILLNRPTLVHIEDRLQPKVSFRKRVSTRLAGAD